MWKVQGRTRGNTEVLLEFSSKGGPADLVEKWDSDGIIFKKGEVDFRNGTVFKKVSRRRIDEEREFQCSSCLNFVNGVPQHKHTLYAFHE